MHRYWSSVLMAFVRDSEHSVELVEGEYGGAKVTVDGIEMIDGIGYPSEIFNIREGDEWRQVLTKDGLEKVRELSD